MFGYNSYGCGGGYGGYGYGGGQSYSPFGYSGCSNYYGGGGYGGGYYNNYGHNHGHGHYHGRRRSSSGLFGNLFGGYNCNRMYHRRRSSGLFSLLFRSLDGDATAANTASATPTTNIFDSYKGEVKPVAPYSFPSEYTGGKVKGLFIGINYTGTKAELKGSCADVGVMLDTLSHIQFPMKEAAILVDDPNFKGASGLPTRDNIIQHMLWLAKDAKAGDVLFLHIVGHANSSPREGGAGEPPSIGLAPCDFETAGLIADDDIYEIVVRSLPKGVRMSIVFDTAQGSGGLTLPFAFAGPATVQQRFGPKMAAELGYLYNQAEADVVMLSGVAGENQGSGACTNALSVAMRTTAGLGYAGLAAAMQKALDEHKVAQRVRVSATKPLSLDAPFSLFGSLAPDTHYYGHGSGEALQQWGGPIPFDREVAQREKERMRALYGGGAEGQGGAAPEPYVPSVGVEPPQAGFVAFH